jgi:hypothetical protein
MAGSPRKPGLLRRTLRRLGPPPLPPRRYCVKFRSYDALHRAGTGSHSAAGACHRAFV